MFVCCTPIYPHLTPCPFFFFFFFFFFFLPLLEYIYYICILFFSFWPHFHQKITIFPLRSNVRNKYAKKKKKILPTYLPNQKIQGRGTANKHFFKDCPRKWIFFEFCKGYGVMTPYSMMTFGNQNNDKSHHD